MNIAFAGFRHDHISGLYRSALEKTEIKIIGCFEENAEAREKAHKELGAEFCYREYSEILNDPEVDIVAIGDYYTKRGKLIIEALENGKHVICDKPLCTSLEDLEKIEKLATEKNLQVCCMLDLRYMPQVAKVKELIESGELGKIHIASFSGQHCLDYENRPKWYFEKGKHGGTINDIAIHGVDLLRFITNKNLTKINYAKVWNSFADKAPDFKDCAQFMIEMEDMSVMADVSYAAPKYNGILPTYWHFELWGSEGMLSFGFEDNKLYIYKDKCEVIDCGTASPELLRDLISEINGKKTILNKDDILQSQRQVLEIQKAAE